MRAWQEKPLKSASSSFSLSSVGVAVGLRPPFPARRRGPSWAPPPAQVQHRLVGRPLSRRRPLRRKTPPRPAPDGAAPERCRRWPTADVLPSDHPCHRPIAANRARDPGRALDARRPGPGCGTRTHAAGLEPTDVYLPAPAPEVPTGGMRCSRGRCLRCRAVRPQSRLPPPATRTRPSPTSAGRAGACRSCASVDSAPWLGFRSSPVRPSKPPPVVMSIIRMRESLSPRNQATRAGPRPASAGRRWPRTPGRRRRPAPRPRSAAARSRAGAPARPPAADRRHGHVALVALHVDQPAQHPQPGLQRRGVAERAGRRRSGPPASAALA